MDSYQTNVPVTRPRSGALVCFIHKIDKKTTVLQVTLLSLISYWFIPCVFEKILVHFHPFQKCTCPGKTQENMAQLCSSTDCARASQGRALGRARCRRSRFTPNRMTQALDRGSWLFLVFGKGGEFRREEKEERVGEKKTKKVFMYFCQCFTCEQNRQSGGGLYSPPDCNWILHVT